MPQHNLDGLERYLLQGERLVVATHRHWTVVAEPLLTAFLGLVLALGIGFFRRMSRHYASPGH